MSSGRSFAEEVFSSRGRVKVLKALMDSGELNITQLIRNTGLNYRSVMKHLKFLMEADLIEELRLGRVRIYRPKWVNPKVRVIEEMLKDLE